ncbi:endonuclease [Campylobacter fetus]|uniref:endonuclease n=1 Tax=Campylobacter fetus TaxID=196 RepID=UPI00073A5A3D|nr:endonuclease [Campylobacter fetus]ALV64637.1 DNA-specific endonuclease I [Campylobacter fetus subsp. testudinum Sp3]
MNQNIKKLFALLFVAAFGVFAYGADFAQSKKLLLKKIYFDHRITFYCSNPYELKFINGKEKASITQDDKYYTPRNPTTKKGKENERAKRVEWEHIMPAENFGRHLECWKNGGRKNCKSDPTFKQMEADMHNLAPAIGEINGDRSNYRYGANLPKIGQYGNCEFEVDFEAKRAYPKQDIRGDIARAYFYMRDQYGINLSNQERRLMEVWDKQDPTDEWERIKNQRVYELQGNKNKFIK